MIVRGDLGSNWPTTLLPRVPGELRNLFGRSGSVLAYARSPTRSLEGRASTHAIQVGRAVAVSMGLAVGKGLGVGDVGKVGVGGQGGGGWRGALGGGEGGGVGGRGGGAGMGPLGGTEVGAPGAQETVSRRRGRAKRRTIGFISRSVSF